MDQDVEMHVENDSDAGIELTDEEHEIQISFPPTTEQQCFLHLQSIWKEINPPVTEEQLSGKKLF